MPVRPFAIVHYHEIGLKGRNRSTFENRLVANLGIALRGTGVGKVRKLPGRIIIPFDDDADRALISERLARVFGVANVGLGAGGRLDLDAMCRVAWESVRERDFATFAV